MRLRFDEFAKQFKMELKNGATLSAEISQDEAGTLTRINNAVERVPQLLQEAHERVYGLKKQTETIRAELDKPFPYAKDLGQKEERMTVLLQELSEAEKEQSAQRALKKTPPAQPVQGDKPAAAGVAGKSITSFLQDFRAPQPAPTAKSHGLELVH